MQHKVLAIGGPTAVGKTALAIGLALRLGGEVISADSMQVYRGLDVGTAKPTQQEMQGVPHHLIDVCDPDEVYSVARFQADAQRLITEIAGRGRLPILVGGTGLYMRAALRAYSFTEEQHDPELRRRLEAEAEGIGNAAMHARLVTVDPAAARRIHPNDRRRIVRAFEVLEQTGRPISESQYQLQAPPRYEYQLVGLTMERSRLYARIEERTDAQLVAGWPEEVAELLRRYPPRLAPLRYLGYGELVAWRRGLSTWAEAVAAIKLNTRRYAKRQLTWFRAEPRIRWYDVGEAKPNTDLVEEISRLWQEFKNRA